MLTALGKDGPEAEWRLWSAGPEKRASAVPSVGGGSRVMSNASTRHLVFYPEISAVSPHYIE